MTHVVLFKSPEEDSDIDPYASALSELNLRVSFIPVLRHARTNEDELRKIVRGGPHPLARYGGVIATSSRAAEMWVRAIREVIGDGYGSEIDWRLSPFYVVGQKTSRVLSGGESIPQDSVYKPTLLLGAEESGTAAKLAEFILSDYPTRVSASSEYGFEGSSSPPWGPLLYLTGDKTMGTLLETLKRDGRIRVEQLQVYRTWPREDFEEDFIRLREHFVAGRGSSSATRNLTNAWFVFFAPSAARAVLPTANRHFQFRKSLDHSSDADIDAEQARPDLEDGSPEESHTNVRIAAIGPTTAAYLRTDAQLFVDFVPEKPGPAELTHGIASVNVILSGA